MLYPRFNSKYYSLQNKLWRFNSKYYSIQKKSADSIQKIIQFNSQGIINTGWVGKLPKNSPKSVQNRQKRGLFIKNGKYWFKIWFIHSFHNKMQFKGLFNIIFFRNIQFKKLFNNFFSWKIQFKNWFKKLNLAWFKFTKLSIQLENQGIEDHYLIPKWKETKRRNFILNMDIFFCLRSWDDTLDLDLRCLGCTAVIIPEMLLYADKAI